MKSRANHHCSKRIRSTSQTDSRPAVNQPELRHELLVSLEERLLMSNMIPMPTSQPTEETFVNSDQESLDLSPTTMLKTTADQWVELQVEACQEDLQLRELVVEAEAEPHQEEAAVVVWQLVVPTSPSQHQRLHLEDQLEAHHAAEHQRDQHLEDLLPEQEDRRLEDPHLGELEGQHLEDLLLEREDRRLEDQLQEEEDQHPADPHPEEEAQRQEDLKDHPPELPDQDPEDLADPELEDQDLEDPVDLEDLDPEGPEDPELRRQQLEWREDLVLLVDPVEDPLLEALEAEDLLLVHPRQHPLKLSLNARRCTIMMLFKTMSLHSRKEMSLSSCTRTEIGGPVN